MSFVEFLTIVRKRWAYVAVPLLLGVAGALWLSLSATKIYEARSSAYFSLPFGQSASDLFQGSNYTQQQLASYAELARSPIVLEPVIDDLDLDTTTTKLARRIGAVASADTVIVTITASDPDPETAADLANAVTSELQTVVGRLSPARADGQPAVSSTTTATATAPTVPSSPSTRRNVAAGLIGGLLLGLLAALAREKLDTRVRERADLPPDVPLLGQVAYDRAAKKRSLALVSHSGSTARAEGFRRLRTNLRFIDVDGPVKTIVVTSTIPGEGKSSMATNLALVLAESGQRVILVEADLRRPRAQMYLGVEGAVGLADVLAGQASLEEVTQTWQLENLVVLPTGTTPPNPSELLGSQAMANLLKRLKEEYDAVIIDTPPLLAVTDAAEVAGDADGVIVVNRYGRIPRAQLETALGALRAVDARLLGVVINAVPQRRRNKGYGYYQASAPDTVPAWRRARHLRRRGAA